MRLFITLLFTLILCGCGQNETVDSPNRENMIVERYAWNSSISVYRFRVENGWIYTQYNGGMLYIKDE